MPGPLQFQPDPNPGSECARNGCAVSGHADEVGTLLDVRQGEQLVYAAARARRHKMLSPVQLYKALGGGWQE